MNADEANVQGLLPLPAAAFHILLALSAGECHGYGIIQDVEARTNGALRLSPGTLYRTIQRLLEQGVIEQACADATPLRRVRLLLSAAADEVLNALAVHWANLIQDLRYTARTLIRAPGFAVTAILVTALGVGANTAAFSVADFVLIRPLPYSDTEVKLGPSWEWSAISRSVGWNGTASLRCTSPHPRLPRNPPPTSTRRTWWFAIRVRAQRS